VYVVPAELPPPPGLLVGRDDEVDTLCRALTQPSRQGGPLVIAVTGEPGVGKSALAVNVAHLVRDHYPGGQLLFRFDRQGMRTADDALAACVAALNGPREDAPEPEERDRWYRERTANGQVLVILDNVAHVPQLSRLLPAGPRCATVVTSPAPVLQVNPQLTVPVAPLEAKDGMALFEALLGAKRVAAERQAAAKIVEAAGGYLVALQIAGAVLKVRHNWRLETIVRRMEASGADGDGDPSLPFVGILDLAFALSTVPERMALCLLGPLGADIVSPWMLAALFRGATLGAYTVSRGTDNLADGTDTVSENMAGHLLDRLARLRLVERRVDDGSGAALFRVPPYVHSYANIRAAAMLTPERQEAAKQAYLVEWQRRGERTPQRLERANVYRLLDQGLLGEALENAREALALSQEVRTRVEKNTATAATVSAEEGMNLTAIAEICAELGWIDEGTTRAEEAMREEPSFERVRPRAHRVRAMLRCRLHLIEEAEQDLRLAQGAASLVDDPTEVIRVLRELAFAYALSSDPGRGLAVAERARERCVEAGLSGRRRLPGVLLAHASVLHACRRFEDADQVLAEADVRSGETALGQQRWRPWIRHQRALVHLSAGRYEQSREMSLCALEGFTMLRHRYGVGHSRLAIGRAYLYEARNDLAISALDEAHSTLRQCGDRWLEADAAAALARAYHRAMRGREAVGLLTEAEQAFRKLGDASAQSLASRLLREVESSLPPPAGRFRETAALLGQAQRWVSAQLSPQAAERR
jgi:tetratricopeptide (TPR) repeat protein